MSDEEEQPPYEEPEVTKKLQAQKAELLAKQAQIRGQITKIRIDINNLLAANPKADVSGLEAAIKQLEDQLNEP